MRPIDSHAHIDDTAFDVDRETVIRRIQTDMDIVVNIGCDIKTSQKSIELAKKYDFFYATVGIHPMEIAGYDDSTENELEKMAENKKVVAIGEIGLDYHWMTRPKEEQIEVFIRQMKLAEKLGKPISIHSREAMEDTLKVLEQFPEIQGILHCYPWDAGTAKRMIKRFYLGIGGVLTFKNSKKLVETVREIPIERLVLETDCPYMTPVPFRGERNEPCNVKYVAQKISEIKNIPYEEVISITNKNARDVYHLG